MTVSSRELCKLTICQPRAYQGALQGHEVLQVRDVHWQPTGLLAQMTNYAPGGESLPDGFHLTCITAGREGGAQIAAESIEAIIAYAKLWGAPILRLQEEMTAAEHRDLDLLWFLYQKSLRTHSFLKRAFESIKDFRTGRRAQQNGQRELTLPIAFQGDAVNGNRLLELGCGEADKRNQTRPTTATQIRLGLYACACTNPLFPRTVSS